MTGSTRLWPRGKYGGLSTQLKCSPDQGAAQVNGHENQPDPGDALRDQCSRGGGLFRCLRATYQKLPDDLRADDHQEAKGAKKDDEKPQHEVILQILPANHSDDSLRLVRIGASWLLCRSTHMHFGRSGAVDHRGDIVRA